MNVVIPSKSLETIDDVMCQTITTIDQLRQLEPEWNALLNKVNGAFFQTYSFCFHSWNEIAKHANRSLICIVIRKKGQLHLVWPLMRYRRALWSISEPLGPRTAQYTAPLVEDSDFSLSHVRLAWQFLVKTIKSDIINLPFIKTDAAWQKGGVENANGRLRRWLPRHMTSIACPTRKSRTLS
jgi:CelD/BcsL family acetyltransferase involved in cellulose biosynthesis